MARTVAVPASAQPNQMIWFSAAWVVLCFALGAVVAWQVAELRSSSVAIEQAARALEQTGRSVEELESLPFLGEDIEGTGAAILDAAEDADRLARSTEQQVLTVAIAAGLGIALLPTMPVIALLYSLLRRRRRQLDAVRRVLRDPGRAPFAIEMLARQATAYVPVDRLADACAVSGRLTDAQLARMELRLLGADESEAEELVPLEATGDAAGQ